MSESDERELRGLAQQLWDGWNGRSGNTFAAPFAEDADYVVVDGIRIKGRDVIAAGHQQIFDTIYRDSHNTATVRNIRFLSDDIAVAHVEWNLTLQQDTAVHKAMATAVMARNDGSWSIAAYHNTPVVLR